VFLSLSVRNLSRACSLLKQLNRLGSCLGWGPRNIVFDGVPNSPAERGNGGIRCSYHQITSVSCVSSYRFRWQPGYAVTGMRRVRFVSVGAKLSFVEPGRRWAHSPSPSKAPGISTGYYENLREDVIKLRRSLTVIWYFCLFMLSTLHLALGILRCPTR